VHKHIGFYIGKGIAVSNSSKKKVVAKHDWEFSSTTAKQLRPIEAIYWLPLLR
jgi:hypothetical protein